MRKIIVLLIITLYGMFLTVDIFFYSGSLLSNILKFTSIVMCFFLACSYLTGSLNKKDTFLVVLALFFTIGADIFLLFTNYHVIGIAFFITVQCVYLIRYNKSVLQFSILYFIIAILIFTFTNISILYIFSGLYAVLILSTLWATFKTSLSRYQLLLVRVGMILFILCDIHVALFNVLLRYSPYFNIASVAMWLFYLPSQFLIALSARNI